MELKVERELTHSLINKVDRIKETAKRFKEQLSQLTNTPECKSLLAQLEEQKSAFERKYNEMKTDKDLMEHKLEALT